jgi:hypothetical protein
MHPASLSPAPIITYYVQWDMTREVPIGVRSSEVGPLDLRYDIGPRGTYIDVRDLCVGMYAPSVSIPEALLKFIF